jgi:hypothetical protein
MTRPPPHWPPPNVDHFGLGTTLGQLLAHHSQSVDLHGRSLVMLQETRDAIRDLPEAFLEELDVYRRRHSLSARIKRVWPMVSGMAYLIAVVTGKLGVWDAVFKILG